MIRRAQPQKYPIDQFPQRLFNCFGGEISHPAGCSGADKAHDDRNCGDYSGGGDLSALGTTFIEALQQVRDGSHHGDIGRQGDPLAEYIAGNILFTFLDRTDQSFVNHHRGNRPPFTYAWNFTEK